ncbi:putative multidrug-efflux transporter [Micromonospora sp. MW-13]|uniref:MFS transporter n=1 Tax=Micromonospora sp. MW-13 TaxID=2094022 RepID=UPI000E4526D4|nr:MFS transporter [Micromonospora sp. MW-13]RGC66835.1 putative multidrug-efflux transporter [Micromonospora sp. MW-13]
MDATPSAPGTRVAGRSQYPLYAVLTAHGISLAGNSMTYLAVPWFVLETTGSATQTGIAAAASFLPILLSMTFGGVLVDRIGYRRASVIADLFGAAMVALIPLLHIAGMLTFPTLLALVFLGAAFDVPGNAAREALLPALAQRSGMSIERASSVLEVVERGARMAGAPLAGVLIALIGPVNVLLVDAGTFVLAALIVAVSGAPRSKPAATRESYLAGLLQGFTFLWRDRLLRSIALLLAVTNMLDVAYVSVVLPVYGDEVLSGAGAVGLLIGTSAVAGVAGGIAFGAVAHRLPRRLLFTVVFMLVGLPRCLVLAAEPALPLIFIVVAATGFCAGMINPILRTAQYHRIPENMRARGLGAISAAAFAMVPLGPIVGGGLISYAGLTGTLLIFACVYAVATFSLVPFKVWREIDATPSGSRTDPQEKQ